MPNQQSGESRILDELRGKSIVYMEKSTRLSHALEQAEDFLNELPSKVSIGTEVEQDTQYRLWLQRAGKDSWCLMLDDYEAPDKHRSNRVTHTNVFYKAKAAELLPELYGLLIDHFEHLQNQIDKGLAKLKELPFLDLSDIDTSAVEFRDDEASIKEGPSDDEIPF